MDVSDGDMSEPGVDRRFLRLSIIWKLTAFVGVTVALVGGALVVASYAATSLILREQIEQRLSTIAADRQEALTTVLRTRLEQARELARRARIRQFLAQSGVDLPRGGRMHAEVEALLAEALESSPGTLAVWIERENGERLAQVGPKGLIEAFQTAAGAAQEGVGLPRRQGETYAVTFRALVTGAEFKTLGSVNLLVDFSPTVEFLIDLHGLGGTGEVLAGVLDGTRIHLISPPRFGPRLDELPLDHQVPLDAAVAGKFGFMRTMDYRGHEVWAAYRPAGYAGQFLNWGVMAKLDASEADEPAARLRGLLLAIASGALVIGLIASNLVARQVSRPIRRLARSASAVARGDLAVRCEIASRDEIGALGQAFNHMTEELSRSYATLENRIQERTRDLVAARDLLDAFFQISTSRMDPDNIEKTYDSVLRFCRQLGYEQAMISLVDRASGVIRAVRAAGSMAEIVSETVRALDGEDVLALVVREGRSLVIADSRLDPRCDQAATRRAGIRGQIILPLVSDEVLGTLQVASYDPLDPTTVDPRPLETLASHAARALESLRRIEEIRRLNQNLEEQAKELARGQAALKEQTRILQSVLDCMGDGLVVADAQGHFLVFNPAARRILGQGPIAGGAERWSRAYDVYLPDRKTLCPPDQLPLSRAMRGESLDDAELYIAYPNRDDGTWITVSGRPLSDESGRTVGGVVAFHATTRRKKADRRLAAQYESTRVLAEEDSPDRAFARILAILGTNLDWDQARFWNADRSGKHLHLAYVWSSTEPGADPAPLGARSGGEIHAGPAMEAGRKLEPLWLTDQPGAAAAGPASEAEPHPGAVLAVPLLLHNECVGVLEFSSVRARPVDPDMITMVSSLGTQIAQFIDRRQMRARVAQAEKLASLGMLSAGVAHEINNPLAYVVNNLAVIERDVQFLFTLLDLYERANDLLSQHRPTLVAEIHATAERYDLNYVRQGMGKLITSTRRGIKRVAEIVENLRGFARLDRAKVDQVDIQEALAAALEMIRGRLDRRGIQVEELGQPLPPITGSPAQLNQVFLNLLVNALQAIESTGRSDGRITISTTKRNGDAVVEITDNGCGIAPDILPQIFNPFFTTKPVGDGTGLGLSITHGMVQDHGGRLEVESQPNQGSTFRVILPMHTNDS